MVKVKFIADSKEFLDIALPWKPKPASYHKPKWLKDMKLYVNDIKTIDVHGDPTSTMRKCVPVSDSMKSGYHIYLPCDVWVHNNNGNIKLQWSWKGMEFATVQRKDQYQTYPIPEGYSDFVFKWLNHWIVRTPRNWSCLFTHPMHTDELPFRCLPAMVDTDKYPTPVHFPFLLKKDFEGLIRQGTPIIQVIPFKREKFISEYSYDKDFKLAKIWKRVQTSFFDRYSNNFHTKKDFSEGGESKCPFAFLHPKK